MREMVGFERTKRGVGRFLRFGERPALPSDAVMALSIDSCEREQSPLAKGTELGLSASQAMQWSASGLLSTVHIEHVQVPGVFVGSLSPAAAQLKATGVALSGAGAGMSAGIVGDIGGGAEAGADAAASGLGASHTEHLLRVSFVLQLQRVYVHSHTTGVLGFNSAAAQSKGEV
jgi:hypothetical protein